MFPVAHLIGRGGAGKSTIGAVTARRLNWRFVDLDQCFLSWHGHIGGLIDRHGYAGYARRNIQLYADLRHRVAEPMVCALSSGFMTYPSGHCASLSIHPQQHRVRCTHRALAARPRHGEMHQPDRRAAIVPNLSQGKRGKRGQENPRSVPALDGTELRALCQRGTCRCDRGLD